MRKSDKLSKQLLETCCAIYPVPIKLLLDVGDTTVQFYDFLEQNRLSCIFAIKNTNNKSVNSKFQNHLTQTRKRYSKYQKDIIAALNVVCTITDSSNFMVVKTFSNYPHLTSDLDLVFRSENEAKRVGQILSKNQDKPAMLIDIQYNLTWTNKKEVCQEFIWKNTKKHRLANMTLTIPNPDLDLLIRFAHIPFEMGKIRLGELLHMYRQAKFVNWEKLEKEAQHMGWLKTYKRMHTLFNHLHFTLFNKPLFKNSAELQLAETIHFPYNLSYWFLLLSVIERRAWYKLWGGRYILIDRFKQLFK